MDPKWTKWTFSFGQPFFKKKFSTATTRNKANKLTPFAYLDGPHPPLALLPLCSVENRLDLPKTSRLLEAAVVRLGEYGGQAYRNHKNIRSRWD